MRKLKLDKVKTKKQLEEQGFCRIDQNKGYWDYDWGKYVLVSDYDFYFENIDGDILSSTPVNTIKDAIKIYNNGVYKS